MDFCVFLEGIYTWTRLHVRMVVMLPKFNQSATACRKKHENLFKAYNKDKMANGILGNAFHESKFFDAIDEWWHQTGQVMWLIIHACGYNPPIHSSISLVFPCLFHLLQS